MAREGFDAVRVPAGDQPALVGMITTVVGWFATGDVAYAATDTLGNFAAMSCQHAIALGRYAGNNVAAELLGVESGSVDQLASVRFSGMLREQVGAEAFRFEEVWNLFKPEQGGWLLAGIQQIPVTQAS